LDQKFGNSCQASSTPPGDPSRKMTSPTTAWDPPARRPSLVLILPDPSRRKCWSETCSANQNSANCQPQKAHRFLPSASTTPGSASRMMSSSMAALDCAHSSTRYLGGGFWVAAGGWELPSIRPSCKTGALGRGGCWAGAVGWRVRRADTMAITVEVLPVPGGPYTANTFGHIETGEFGFVFHQ